MTFDVMTLNTWFGYNGKGTVRMGALDTPDERSQRRQGLLELLGRTRPTLIALQEVCPLPQMARRLAALNSWDVRHQLVNAGVKLFGHGIPIGFAEGLALMVGGSFRVEWCGWRRLSGPMCLLSDRLSIQLSECRGALGARLVSPSGLRLYFFTIHLHFSPGVEGPEDMARWGQVLEELGGAPAQIDRTIARLQEGAARRIEELETFLSWVDRVAGPHPVVIAGDLNLRAQDPTLQRLLHAHGLEDALASTDEPTWAPRTNPLAARSTSTDDDATLMEKLEARYDRIPRRIDHILTRNIEVASEGKIQPAHSSTGQLISDHHMASVTLVTGKP